MPELRGWYSLTPGPNLTPAAARDQLAEALRSIGYTVTSTGHATLRYEWAQPMAPRRLRDALLEGTFDFASAPPGMQISFRMSLDALVWPIGSMLTIVAVGLLAVRQWSGAGLTVGAAAAMYFANRLIWRHNAVAFIRRTFPPTESSPAAAAPAA